MKYLLTSILITLSTLGYNQTRTYKGFIDKYPIHLTTYSYSDGETKAIYIYDKFDTPIVIDGNLSNDTLTLLEKDKNEKTTAQLQFAGIDFTNNQLEGEWINLTNQSKFKIKLIKTLEFDSYDDTQFNNIEFMQSESTSKHYFKLLISKDKGKHIDVTGVRIYEKKTDRLIQEIKLNCQLLRLSNVSIGDYNFDGLLDFSVFEQSYAGPNTSSIYILKRPNSEKYFVSNIKGISLEFDNNAKLIYERNQCCAGRSIMNATYKIEKNKMVLVHQKCIEYDEEKDDFIEVDCD